jgi:hypothetical protein
LSSNILPFVAAFSLLPKHHMSAAFTTGFQKDERYPKAKQPELFSTKQE